MCQLSQVLGGEQYPYVELPCSVAPQHGSGLGTPKVTSGSAALACLGFAAPKYSLFDHAVVCLDLGE